MLAVIARTRVVCAHVVVVARVRGPHAGAGQARVGERTKVAVVARATVVFAAKIAAAVLVADVPQSIVVAVSLSRIRGLRAVIGLILHIVPVVVRITQVAGQVLVEIELTGVGHRRAVVVLVVHRVTVVVRVTFVADAVIVQIQLLGVVVRRTVVLGVNHVVAVVVQIHAVGDAVGVLVRVPVIRLAVAVVIQPVAFFGGSDAHARSTRTQQLAVGDITRDAIGSRGVRAAVRGIADIVRAGLLVVAGTGVRHVQATFR